MSTLSLSNPRLPYLFGSVISLLLPLLAWRQLLPQISLLEAVAVVISAWSVWLLARNHPFGWWVGLVGVTLYAVVFYQVQLYAEVGIQGFYFITSLQAILLWRQGGSAGHGRPVGRIGSFKLMFLLIIAAVATLLLREGLIALRGAAPFWDALTTVLSIIAHLLLMARCVESWYLWIAVDTMYIPLYASRGLYLTALLYGVFWCLAVEGLYTFRRTWEAQQR